MTILDAMRDPALFGGWFAGDSWRAWRAFLAALFALPMSAAELELYRTCTGRRAPPAERVREAVAIVGRRGGKSRIAALLAVYAACFRSYADVLAPGEVGTVPVIAADRRQARTILRYINGFFDAVPMLGRMVASRTKETITLRNRVVIEVHTASFRSLRGYTVIAAVLDEVAFWQDDAGSNPASEIYQAILPGMLSVPGAVLFAVSSPYARRGLLYDLHKRHYGRDDSGVLVLQAPSEVMNPGLDRAMIAAAYAADPHAAAAEYGAEFRVDVEQLVTVELVMAVTAVGRESLPYDPQHAYVAACDPAGGQGQDSMTLAIGHLVEPRTNAFSANDPLAEWGVGPRQVERQAPGTVVIDVLVERRPPFSPADVVEEFARLMQHYRVYEVVGDKFSGGVMAEMFGVAGVDFRFAAETTSGLYGRLLIAITSRSVELPDSARLQRQLCALERRNTRAAGHPVISHPARGHDDLAACVAGVVGILQADAHRGSYALEPFYGV